MKNTFTEALSTPVPQSEPENPRQVANNAGGYTFTVDDKVRLERFLVLGTTGGTFYVGEKALTKQNLDFLDNLIEADEDLVRQTVYNVSYNGRAAKNSPALFALAKLLVNGKNKQAIIDIGPDIARTFYHLSEFAEYVELLGANSHAERLQDPAYAAGMEAVAHSLKYMAAQNGKTINPNPKTRFSGSPTGGWGSAKRRFVAHWYQVKTAEQVAYQGVKYRQRNGWTHGNLLQLSHPKGLDPNVATFLLGKDDRTAAATTTGPEIIRGFKFAQEAATKSELLSALEGFPNLPWETIPTQFLKEPEVWMRLFYNGQLRGQALVRNITRLSRIGAFKDMVFTRDYADKLADEEMIAKTRLHPINFLNAQVVHTKGQVDRHKGRFGYSGRIKDWTTVPQIVDALNAGFHTSFKHIEPAGKRTFLALDTSGSMWWETSMCTGLDISAASAVACMSMVTARTEPYYQVKAFAHVMKDIGITPNMNLSQIDQAMQRSGGGGTDCSLPMLYAKDNHIEVDTFVIYTDNETWAGRRHPHVELREYRRASGINAKMIVVGVAATNFTVADPADAGMLDVVGFDANAPGVIADFSAGRI